MPNDEREVKSKSRIKYENENIITLSNEIKNTHEINETDRTTLMGLLTKTKLTNPLLTYELLLEYPTKAKISELVIRIDQLSSEFNKKDYPYETLEQKNKRLNEAKVEGGRGASGTAIENTVELPTMPKPDKGLKSDDAAQVLKIISDDFVKLRNHNLQYKP